MQHSIAERPLAVTAPASPLTVERVLVANPHGYCAGVLFALRGADLARQIYRDRPVWDDPILTISTRPSRLR